MINRDSIQIDYLANYPKCVPKLANWFYDEWNEFYDGMTVKDVAKTINDRLNYDKIPLAFVAFYNKTVVGTVCLKQYDIDTRKDLSPWLAGLYVRSVLFQPRMVIIRTNCIQRKLSFLKRKRKMLRFYHWRRK